jgi:hypothetical protein
MMRLRAANMMAVALLVLAACDSPGWAIVLHDDNQVPPAQRPANQVIGKWQYNASCVVIGPSLVLTTTHQGASQPSSVTIEGVTYDALSPPGFSGGPSGTSDIRIAELSINGESADLGYWVELCLSGSDVTDEVLVFGGYGMGRGATLTTAGGTPYGYQWDQQPNTTLRWGQNRVDQQVLTYMTAGFDGVGSGYEVAYEAAVAEYDSGGGWFIKEDGRWYVAGLTIGTTHADLDQSWFASNVTGAHAPDRLDAIRVESYEPWITEKMALVMPTPGDADRDGDVDYDDLVLFAAGYGAMANAGWSFGNFDGDGDVDLVDLIAMSRNYGTGAPAGLSFADDLQTVGLVPEPTTIGLMVVGGLVLLRRRDSNSP